MKLLNSILAVVLLGTFAPSPTQGQNIDQTLIPLSKGRDVAEASINKIQRSGIFTDDQNFLTRLAYVESQFGLNSQTYRANYTGGIWQLDERFFTRTINQSALNQYYQNISTHWGINWNPGSPSRPNGTIWNDLLRPFYSALGMRLYIQSLSPLTIPGTISGQASFWQQHIHPDGNISHFIGNVTQLESSRVCSGKMDIVIVLDGSGSIGNGNFALAKGFIADVALSFKNHSSESTRLGLVLYSDFAEVIFDLENKLSPSALNNTIRNMRYPAKNTNTPDGLLGAVDLHRATKQNNSSRPGVPRIIATFTDGQTNRGNLSNALLTVRNESLTSFAVGISKAINDAELLQIALGESGKVLRVEDYASLTEFVYRLNSETCEVAQDPEVGENRTDSLQKGERRFYKFKIPLIGLTIKIKVKTGVVNGWFSFSETTPNSAVHDGVIKNGFAFVPYKAPKGTARQAEGPEVHVMIQGDSDNSNDYTISTEEGDKVPNGGHSLSASILISSIVLLISKFIQ